MGIIICIAFIQYKTMVCNYVIITFSDIIVAKDCKSAHTHTHTHTHKYWPSFDVVQERNLDINEAGQQSDLSTWKFGNTSYVES